MILVEVTLAEAIQWARRHYGVPAGPIFSSEHP